MQRLVYDLDRTSVRIFHYSEGLLAQFDVTQDRGTIFINVAAKGPIFLSMCNEVAKATTGLYHLRSEPEHFDVALVADDQLVRRIKQQQALRHVVDGYAEPAMLPRQLPNDQKHHDGDYQRREASHGDQQSCLPVPVA